MIFEGKFKESLKEHLLPLLTPTQISSLSWPARSRYGIVDKQIKLLIHYSDSEAWIKGELKRRALETDQLVVRL